MFLLFIEAHLLTLVSRLVGMRLKTRPGELFETLVAAKVNTPCEFKTPREPPVWLDKDLFETGRKCYNEYSLALLLSSYMATCVGLSVPNLRLECLYTFTHT